MDRPYGISDFAFPTRWDRDSGPDVVERAGRGSDGIETKLDLDMKRTEILIGLAAVSTGLERSIEAATGTTGCANQKFARSPT